MAFKKIKTWIEKKRGIETIRITDLGLWDGPFSGDDLAGTIFNAQKKTREQKNRIPVKPIDIIHDLENSVNFPKDKIKEAIKELQSRIKFMNKILKTDVDDEHRALAMLKAREKYPKYAHLFKWKTTTASHIKKLLDKYDLDHKNIKYYVRSIPHKAIVSMQLYAGVFAKVSKETPNFTIIAPTEYFKDPKNKTDPILLAESPFGTFYYILFLMRHIYFQIIPNIKELLKSK